MKIQKDIVEKWLKAWSLSRELPLPVPFKSGYKVEVGYENQKSRYVFPELNNDFIRLSKSVEDPFVFMKVCASQEDVKNKIPEKWQIQPQGYMMSCFRPMKIPDIDLPDEYNLESDLYNSTFLLRIVTENGKTASTGRVVMVDDLAVYDQILTEENHRRKGLATFLIKELEKIALSKGIYKNFLVATEQGKRLYQSLGFDVYSLYTSAVIPVDSE